MKINDIIIEVAPPGRKAERMVKRIKKNYAKDGNLTAKERSIAYATAWKAYNKGVFKESNVFINARMNAIKAGKDTFVVNGKTYKISGDISDEKQARVVEDSVSLNEVPMADYRPLGVKDPLYSTAVTDSKIVKGLEEQELDEGGWASAATQNTKITPAVIGEAVGILKEFETEFNQWQANQELDVEIKIGNPVGSGTYYKRDLAQDPERLYGDVDVMCYIHGREGVGAAHRTAEYAEAVEEFTQGHSNYSTDNGTNVFMVTSAGLVQVDLIYTYHEHANWARMLAPEYRVKGVINTSLVSSVAEVLNLSIGVQGIQVKTRGGQPVNFRQGKDIKLSTVSVNPENWGADIYSYYYELEHGALPKIPANLAKHGGLKDEQRISDIVLTIKAVVTSMEREKLLGTGALSHIANKRDMIQQIARIFGAKLEKVINSSKFDKGITPMAKKNANKTKLMLAKYRNEITKLLLN